MAPNKRTYGMEYQRTTMEVDIGDGVRHDSRESPVETTSSSANRLNDEKRPYHSSELRESTPEMAFFVDPSQETFRSFLDFIKIVCAKQSTVNSVIRGKHAAAHPIAASPQKGKILHMRKAGPERSPCSESPLAQTERFIEHPKAQQNAPPGRSNSIVSVSEIATVEVLRCTLRILTVNLFHLVRDTAIRRAWRENGVDFERVTPTISRKMGIHASGSKVLLAESRDERKPIAERKIAFEEDEHFSKLAEGNKKFTKNPDDRTEEAGRDIKHTMEGLVPHELWTKNMHGVIQELGQILRDIMEEESYQSARVSKDTFSLCRVGPCRTV